MSNNVGNTDSGSNVMQRAEQHSAQLQARQHVSTIKPNRRKSLSTYDRVPLQSQLLVANQDMTVHADNGVSYDGLFIRNNSAYNLYYEIGKAATAGSDVVQPGGWISDDCRWRELHFMSTGAVTINDINAGGIVAWGVLY